MAQAIQLNTLVAEAMDPSDIKANLEFAVSKTKDATAQTREHWEGYLDDARTVRVKAYIPAGYTDKVIQYSIEGDRRKNNEAPDGVKRSLDGKVNITFLEDKGVLTLLYTPVAAPAIATVKLVRG